MVYLVKIGNSQGVRIPKPLVEQAHLKGHELKFKLHADGLLITPKKGIREGWEEQIKQVIVSNGYEYEEADEWLNLPLSSDDDLEW